MSWKEITFDTIRVTDTYLDMVLFCKPGIWVERLSLPKHSFHRIVRMLICIAVNLVGSLNDSAVKFANQSVCRLSYVCILRERLAKFFIKVN